MLSRSSYMLTALAALIVNCHALWKFPEVPRLAGMFGLPGRDGLRGQQPLPGLIRPSGNLIWPPGKGGLPCVQGLHNSLDTELYNILVNLGQRLSRLEGVLALNGKITEVGEKILASNGKEVDFASALESCEKAGGTLATPMNEEENNAVLSIVKQYNKYAYLGIKGDTSGQFKYIDDTPLNYTKWHKYEPNGKGTEKCVEMYTDGSWNDKKCNLYRLTICEF